MSGRGRQIAVTRCLQCIRYSGFCLEPRRLFTSRVSRDILGTGKTNDWLPTLRLELAMAYTTLDETQIKDLFKQAFEELLQERRDLLYELVADIIEDFALTRAIKEGEDTATVGKEEVFQVLEGVA